MTTINTDSPAQLAGLMLEQFPPLIRRELLSDRDFLDKTGITTDADLLIGDSGISVSRSELFDAIKAAFAALQTTHSSQEEPLKSWRIEVYEQALGQALLVAGEKKFLLNDYWLLLPDSLQRANAFMMKCEAFNLPPERAESWKKEIKQEPVNFNILEDIQLDFKHTPTHFSDSLKTQLKSNSSFTSLVPDSPDYFFRLAGACEDHETLEDFVTSGLKSHLEQLLDWNPKEALLLSLLLSAHEFITSAIDLVRYGKDVTAEVFEELSVSGDHVSQLGAIECGLAQLNQLPELEPFIVSMIEQFLGDNPSEPDSQFQLLSSLIMLVDGQLSIYGFLRKKPPFWRRLASITHSALIERVTTTFKLDIPRFSKWAEEGRGHQLYFQSLCDLRREPNWLPEYVSPTQLKAEFLGRIWGAAQRKPELISNSEILTKLFSEEDPTGVHSQLDFPLMFLPGPLEGGLQNRSELPDDLNIAIFNDLQVAQLESNSFNTLVNSAFMFKVGSAHAELAAKALKNASYHIEHGAKNDVLFQLLGGLAAVSAMTRSRELAEDIRVLVRKSLRQADQAITLNQALRIALVSAASNEKMKYWSKFIGEWFTELAFEDLNKESANEFHAIIHCLCSIEPELWPALGKAEAALSGYIPS